MNTAAQIADDEFAIPSVNWRRRPHQRALWDYLDNGGKRAVAIWHRRAGKDEVLLHWTALAALQRPANYWYALPEFTQARKAIWDAVNPHSGKRRIDECFPDEIRAGIREHDMQLTLVNGSTIQIVGSDSVVSGGGIGSSVAGIVFSEFALANPSAWAFYRPILEENNGWAAFVSTPRGRNHAFQLYQHAQRTPGWFAQHLTVHDTGALSPAAIAEALREMTGLYGEAQGTALFEQEYLCEWNAAGSIGSFYAAEIAELRKQGRVTEKCVALLDRPVDRFWDLGVGDDTSIWFAQSVGAQLYVLDHYATSGVGLDHYVNVIEQKHAEHNWLHGSDYVPHDAKVREFGSGRTRIETMQAMGLRPVLVPGHTVDDGINAVRRVLPLCVFHPRCEAGGIDALEQYRREWDDEKKAFRASAVHDWTSHPADAFRYMAMAYKPAPLRVVKPPPRPSGAWILPPPPEQRRGGYRL